MGKKIQKKGRCVFCEGTGLTKQHVIPDWLKEYFPHNEKDKRIQKLVYHEFVNDSAIIRPKVCVKPGHLGTNKIRNVCNVCNNGWMSKLEKEVKPLVIQLIQGNINGINKEKQSLLSRWIMLVNIMIEYTDVTTMAIPKEDRIKIMNGDEPEGWTIMIGRCESDKWNFRYSHRGLKTILRKDYDFDNIPVNCTLQFTTIGLGKLYIHAIKSCLDYMPIIQNAEKMGLKQIYPYVKDFYAVEKINNISNADADIIPDLLYNWMIGKGIENVNNVLVDAHDLK